MYNLALVKVHCLIFICGYGGGGGSDGGSGGGGGGVFGDFA